jgi:hypothetical protein
MDTKRCTAVRLGVIYDSKATNRKQGGPLPRHTRIGSLDIIYDSQPAGIHKSTTTNRRKLLDFD